MNIMGAMNQPPSPATRPWWKKKTNWGLGLYVLGKLLYAIPATRPFAPAVEALGAALTGYGIADRAGKPNEGE